MVYYVDILFVSMGLEHAPLIPKSPGNVHPSARYKKQAALLRAFQEKYQQLEADGQARTAIIALRTMNEQDLGMLNKLAPYDAMRSVEPLVQELSKDILQRIHQQTDVKDEPDEQIQEQIAQEIRWNIRSNLRFIRDNLNLYEGLRTDRHLTTAQLMETNSRILEKHMGHFMQKLLYATGEGKRLLGMKRKKSGPDFHEYSSILLKKILPLFENGTIRTLADLQFHLHEYPPQDLPHPVRHQMTRLFNETLVAANQELLSEIDLIPKHKGYSPRETLHTWETKRDTIIERIDAVGPFLNDLVNELWEESNPERPEQIITDLRPPKELRTALLTELLMDMDIQRVLRRIPHRAKTKKGVTTELEMSNSLEEASRHAHMAQLIAVRTAHALSIQFSPSMEKLHDLLRYIDTQTVAPQAGITHYVYWDEQFRVTEHISIQEQQRLNQSKHIPYPINLRYWQNDLNEPHITYNGKPFYVHFENMNIKKEVAIEAKLRNGQKCLEDIYDLARMNFWLMYPLKEILDNPSLETDVMNFARDLGEKSAGLQYRPELTTKKLRKDLEPGEFLIVSNLRTKKGKKNSHDSFKEVRLYCTDSEGAHFEVQLIPLDVALLERDARHPSNHRWLEIPRQLTMILQDLAYMHYPEVHALSKKIMQCIEQWKKTDNIEAST